MANEITIQILEGLIGDQRRHIKSREEAIKENEIRISRLETDIEVDKNMINNCDETITILQDSIKTYKE